MCLRPHQQTKVRPTLAMDALSASSNTTKDVFFRRTRARQNSCFSPLYKMVLNYARYGAIDKQKSCRAMHVQAFAALAVPAQAHVVPNLAAETTDCVQPILQPYLCCGPVKE
jgi:hypothetical protein